MSTELATPSNNTIAARRTGSAAIIDLMRDRSASLAAVASKHLTPEKLIRMFGVALTRVPKLGRCTPMSVLDCAMTCAELGLSPGVLGEVYLIPFEDNKSGTTICTLIIGYKGLVKLARRSGEISTIQAEVVREGDTFNWRLGMDAALEHVPKAEVTAPMTHAWALAKFKDGACQFAVMRKTEIMGIKGRSQGARSGKSPWNNKDDEPEMWKKTALRRLCKLLPLSTESEEAIAKVDQTEFRFDELGALPAAEDVEAPPATGIAEELNGQVADTEAKAADVEARRQKLNESAAKAKEERPKHPTCSPGKAGCGGDFGKVKIGTKTYTVCSEHEPEFRQAT